MKYYILAFSLFLFSLSSNAQCTISASTNASALTCGTAPLAACNGILYIGNGSTNITLSMNAALDLSCLGAIQVIVNNASLDFSSGNNHLTLAEGSSITFTNGGTLTGGSCNASERIYVGSNLLATCNGGAGADVTFATLISLGGTGSLASNSPVCQGSTITLTATAPPNNGPYTYSWSGPGLSATAYNSSSTYSLTATASNGGTYQVKMKSASGTIAIAEITVTVTSPVKPTLGSVTQPTCSVATGSFTITNYSASYTYAVTPSTGVTISGSTITAPAGTYTVTGALGACTSAASSSATVNTQPATPVQPTLGSVTQPTCTVSTGSFTITNYNASYTYAVTPATGVTISGSTITAPAGTYTVKATLGTCSSVASSSVTVNTQPATPVKPTLGAVTQPTCSVATGSFTITNYNASYTYTVTPSTGVTVSGSSITAPAGSYTVTATLGACTSVASNSTTVNAQPSTLVTPTLGTVTQPTCSVATGSFTITNYNASYTYTTTPSTGVTISGSAITAPAGSYTVTATFGACTSAASVGKTVNAQPATPAIPTLGTVTQPTCSVSTGSFSITNYSASYTYAVTPSTGVTISGSTITAPTGSYTVTATLGSCISAASSSATVNVQPATPGVSTLGSIIHPTCSVATGSFTITNYNASYTYVATPSTGVTISGSTITAPAGSYTVTATLGSCTSVASSSTLLNAQPSDTWNGTSWSTGSPPTSGQRIIFAAGTSGSFSSAYDLTGCSCQVNSGTIVINSGHTLTVTNEVIVSGGSLTFEDTAGLVQTNDAAVNSGDITYKRKTTPLKQYDYTYWSSPVVSASLSQLATNSLFYNFNPTINNWAWQSGGTTMGQGVGYIGRAPGGLTYSPTQIVETSFVGIPNNGAINTPIVKDITGYNLIGNPYPSAIDVDLFITANASVTNGTVYFWTHNTAITNNVYTANDYAKYNLTGAVRTSTSAVTGGALPTGKIGAGQGFFIEANTSLTNGTYSATFNDAMRITSNNSQFFKNTTTSTPTTNSISQGLERHRVWLSLRSSLGAYGQMLVGYVQGATNNFDSLFDGKTFAVGNSVSIYTKIGADNLAIQGRSLPFSETDVIPVNYSTTLNGELSIELDDFDGLFTNQNVYLLDKTANALHDLKESPYTFVTASGNFENRFELHFTNDALGTTNPTTDNDIKIITTAMHQLEVISPAKAIAKIEVYDILGKILFTQKDLNTNLFQTNSLQLAPQILLVKVTLDNEQSFTKKVLID